MYIFSLYYICIYIKYMTCVGINFLIAHSNECILLLNVWPFKEGDFRNKGIYNCVE